MESSTKSSGRSPRKRWFFRTYPRFMETSDTATMPGRLQLRYEAMIESNRDILDGARVLDIASHDGRWSFAALHMGANHVTGIEPRQNLVDNANSTFAEYGADPTSYRFVCGDAFEVLPREHFDVDVVLCLGFLYHTLRYPELFRRIRDVDPSYLVIDTTVQQDEKPVIRLFVNQAEREAHAIGDAYSHEGVTLVGRPSLSALTQMLEVYGFKVESKYDWLALIARNPHIDEKRSEAYRDGTRVTLRCGRASQPAQETVVVRG